MSGWRAGLAAVVLAAGFIWVVLRLLGAQFSIGGVYPDYSSLRSDPLGSRLLFEGLARLPGLRVTRNYLPLEYFPEKSATLVLVGLGPVLLRDPEFLLRMERVAGRGHRVVISLTELAERGDARALQTSWQVRMGSGSRQAYFAEAQGWKALDRSGDKLAAIERGFGKGSVVLFADSDLFANASAMEFKRLPAVTAALGSARSIVFDESHFGITESGSVVGLARRYRLLGLAFGLASAVAERLCVSAARRDAGAGASVGPDLVCRPGDVAAPAHSGRRAGADMLARMAQNEPGRNLSGARAACRGGGG
jgi:hypothetical protein